MLPTRNGATQGSIKGIVCICNECNWWMARHRGRPQATPRRSRVEHVSVDSDAVGNASGRPGTPQATPRHPLDAQGTPQDAVGDASGRPGTPQATPRHPLDAQGTPQDTVGDASGRPGTPQAIPRTPEDVVVRILQASVGARRSLYVFYKLRWPRAATTCRGRVRRFRRRKGPPQREPYAELREPDRDTNPKLRVHLCVICLFHRPVMTLLPHTRLQVGEF